MFDKIEIGRIGPGKWKLIIHDTKGKEHTLPNDYPSWQHAVQHLPYTKLTDRGYKVKLPDVGAK